MLYCAVLCCTVLYCAGLCCAVLYCTVLYCTVLLLYLCFRTSPTLNILLYNAIGGSGDELYGIEPASYYIRNLLLTLGLASICSSLAPIAVLADVLSSRLFPATTAVTAAAVATKGSSAPPSTGTESRGNVSAVSSETNSASTTGQRRSKNKNKKLIKASTGAIAGAGAGAGSIEEKKKLRSPMPMGSSDEEKKDEEAKYLAQSNATTDDIMGDDEKEEKEEEEEEFSIIQELIPASPVLRSWDAKVVVFFQAGLWLAVLFSRPHKVS